MEAKVYSVQSAHFHINKSNPAQLIIHAIGQVTSTGWKNGRLIPWNYIKKPDDDIQDFDFVATTPNGVVLWVVSPIEGFTSTGLDNWMKGVRIHSSSNEIVVMLNDKSASAEPRMMSATGFAQVMPVSKMDEAGTVAPITLGGSNWKEPPIAEVTGYSDNLSFDEAFRDAIKNLPTNTYSYPDQLKTYSVVRIGAEFGGIAGFHRLTVTVRGG